MSVCDSCYSPGQCCKRLQLFLEDGQLTFWSDTAIEDAQQRLNASVSPFSIHSVAGRWTDDESGREYLAFVYSCAMLMPSGRCATYETRPDTCRVFEPGLDQLCVHYKGAENSEMIGSMA